MLRHGAGPTLWIILALLVGPPAPSHAADTPRRLALDPAAIDAYVAAEMQAARIPGLSLAIVHGPAIVHLRGFGEADATGRPVTPRTPFILGSLSKSFTALAVMQLAEAGRLDLDAPVQRYLHGFRARDPAASAGITVHHLLTQRSGLPATLGLPLLWRPRPLKALVRLLADAEPIAPPGARFEYSNANYWILGALVETVSREPFGAYVRQHVFEPLGMRASFVSERAAIAAGLAAGHWIWFGVPVPARLPYDENSLASGFLISSAEDMARYVVAHLNGGCLGEACVLSPAGVRALHAPPPGASYAMGWAAGEWRGLWTVSHNGAVGNYSAQILMLPDRELGVVALANAWPLTAWPLTDTMPRIASGVASFLVGQAPPAAAWPARRIHLFVEVGVGLSALGLGGAVWTLRKQWRSRATGPGGGPTSSLRALLVGGLHAIVALGLLVGLPRTLGVSLTRLFILQPDWALWIVVAATVLLAMGIVRVLLAVTTRCGAPARAATDAAHS